MPPSQLKQLKTSLRESGVLAPQQSKKQKRQNAKAGVSAQNRVQRNAALQAIRDRFNPFEIKVTSRSKFDVTTRDGGSKPATGLSRPGVTKSLGEEKRRQTLLREMERKNKIGGIVDRRFGEDDPTMTPEERAAARFARESQKKLRKESMFNLEDDDEDDFQLTHKGQTLTLGDDVPQDDFEEDLHGLEEDQSDSEMPRKRKRILDDDEELEDFVFDDEDGEDQPERKKSKHEVMKEVIAKSKFYKLERQKAKEEDDDLREELDKGLPDLFDMLRGVKPPPKPEPAKDDLESMNPDRAALLKGTADNDPNKEYDQRLKQLTFDKRSQPTDRTKTAEEKAEEEAQRLKALEEERLRRMRGEQESDEEEDDDEGESETGGEDSDDESIPDDAEAFGLKQPSPQTNERLEMGVEDEDDFIIDDDLVETRSDVSLSFDESDEEGSSEEESGEEEEEEDELINGLTLPTSKSGDFTAAGDGAQKTSEGLAYTYPCPEDHESFLEVIKDVPMNDLPTVIQRIRALHHPRLHADNKTKLGRFAAVLVRHVAYMAEQPEHPPFNVLEAILRHIHSLAKSHPESVCMAYRRYLREIATDRPLNLRAGDLVIFTGIATTFPTSDHFHAIATPAHLCLARYLGQGAINSLGDYATGAYAASLCLQYQTISKRYMPEFINYVLNALCNLCPTEPTSSLGFFPARGSQESLRLIPSKQLNPRKLRFWDIATAQSDQRAQDELKLSLIHTFVTLLNSASDLWAGKSAFFEIFEQVQQVLRHVNRSTKGKLSSTVQDNLQSTLDKLDAHLSRARATRRPLLLHNHRPLAIKTAIPKFEETFNPDKHYDPNRERAELNRLKAEFKRERKGAMRELRKDANFIAREKLREKKERDAEYEKKYKRLVAEIQNEEGREANAYEREKRKRQGKW
ncbi:snoRNA-binding rRNA-processing protein NOP14 [Aspergillus novofumigatus IBT 16806]|uniref:Putative rRNA maturation protein n=1 Tax=Aspergillus novofumigatus (strain IBT 16806) TaxID=1392255 RepID=A0A2I1BZX7_ASPN1|nr:putative rRNA maturation protein [Aspergillus novofumigatus IBT 16806]PKX90924.1 putative rRNA maturation protein [Aspergillus novofumigatus IBT 16806]